MNKRVLQVCLLFLMAGTLMACGKESATKDKSKLDVVTTFYPMYDFSKKIVGDDGNVSVLIDGGVEPHDYEPSAKDIAKIQDADVFVYNSKEMETWVPAVLDNIDQTKTKIIEASQGIELLKDESDEAVHEGEESHHHDVDPHVWLDPILVKKQVDTITNGMIKEKPELSAALNKNSAAFKKELDMLDDAYTMSFKKATNKTFVTQHAAFGYLAKRYGLEQEAITGLSTEQEPNPAALGKIETFVKKNKIKIIYTEGMSSSKIGETVASATGAELVDLSTLESLSTKKQEQGADYISVMKDNLKALKMVIK